MEFLLENMDIFGKDFNFTIGGDRLKTRMGGFVTILLFFSILACAGYFGKDIYFKVAPNFITEQLVLPRIPFIELNKFETPLIFYFNIFGGEGLYFPKATFNEKINGTYTPIEIKLEKCNYTYYDSYYKEMSNYTYSCLKYNGSLGEAKYDGYPEKMYSEDERDTNYTSSSRSLWFQLLTCDKYYSAQEKIDKNITCPSKEEYDKLFNSTTDTINMEYAISNSIINPKNYTTPSRNYLYDFPIMKIDLAVDYYRSYDYSVSEVSSDSGFFVEDIKKQYFLEYNRFDETLFKSGFSFIFKFDISYHYNIYSRRYTKVQNLVADVGGFMTIVARLAHFLYDFYLENFYYITMIEKLFNLNIIHEEENYEVKNKNPYNKLEREMIQVGNNEENLNNNVSSSILNQSDSILNNFENKDNNSIKNNIDNNIPQDIIYCKKKLSVIDKTYTYNKIEDISKPHRAGYRANIYPNDKYIANLIIEKTKKVERIIINELERCKFYICCYQSKRQKKK